MDGKKCGVAKRDQGLSLEWVGPVPTDFQTFPNGILSRIRSALASVAGKPKGRYQGKWIMSLLLGDATNPRGGWGIREAAPLWP